jgi:heterodisulfide reductase subunit A-like polyferredoxin
MRAASIQVILCKCCIELPAALKVEKLRKLAEESSNVVSVMTVENICDGKGLPAVVNNAKEAEVDRTVILACHKKDIDPALFKAYRRAGINEFMIEIVNIREEALIPHSSEPERAQLKAEAMLNAALARARLLVPLEKQTEAMKTKNVVIIGAGASGQAAAHAAAKTGAHTILIEKTGKSLKAPGIVMPHSQIVSAKGYGGNFQLTIKAGDKIENLDAAAVVIATGGGWTQLKGPLAKAVREAVPLYKFYESLQAGTVPKGPVVFVDTPDPAGKTMKVQDYAWDDTLETAIQLKKKAPETQVFVMFQEMRAFGLSELAYKEAADLEIKFIRYDMSAGPKIDPKEPTKLSVKDFAHGEVLNVKFGTLVFSSIPSNQDNQVIADALRIPMTIDGGVRRGSMQRWPVTTPRPGVFVCGSALFPKSREAAKAEGEAAGSMAGEFVAKGEIEFGGSVAQVTQEKCSACLTCIRTCPYEAPFIGTASKAEIRLQLCQGCGMCVGICPSKAIELHHYTDDQIMAQTRELLGGDF